VGRLAPLVELEGLSSDQSSTALRVSPGAMIVEMTTGSRAQSVNMAAAECSTALKRTADMTEPYASGC
jgi:hypothetical protein